MREAIEANDTDAMKRTYEDLQNKFQEISAELYKQAAASAGAQLPRRRSRAGRPEHGGRAANRRPAQGQGDVVDAEFEVVDEDKK